ncbi:MAG: hypothetical protein GC164_02430 [Phycisphaera sp.]|nr:hypothetical protein [Phycisphaera sp.]
MDQIPIYLEHLLHQAQRIWVDGGPAMIAIALDALILFVFGFHIQLRFREKGFLSLNDRKLRGWVDDPSQRRGPVGDLLNSLFSAHSVAEMSDVFNGLQTTEIAPFKRDLRLMKICVTVAPLLGLFGTVTGMLATFNALATGSGGDKTMAMIAKGISEALITTETGLVVALPGLFFSYQMTRKYDRYVAFLAHLESICTQTLYRKSLNTKSAA